MKIRRIIGIILGVALLFFGAQLAIPAAPPFTLTTLAIFLISALLTPIDSLISVFIYLALGAVGVPIFSNLSGGVGTLFGVGGGFFLSFLLIAPLSSFFLRRFKKSFIPQFSVFFVATFISYIFEATWLLITSITAEGLGGILSGYVLPFLPLDLAKAAIAPYLIKKLRGIIKNDRFFS